MKHAVKIVFFFILSFIFAPITIFADGMMIPRPNHLIRETDQKAVIWHDGKTETLIVSITFKGDSDEFAWVIPVPAKPEVEAGVDELFTGLAQLTNVSNNEIGFFGSVDLAPAGMETRSTVTVVETKKVDMYDITVLTAEDTTDLREWLEENGYEYPENKEHLLTSYVKKGWYFVAAKVSTELLPLAGGLKTGHATPLKITFASEKIVYPLKISGKESNIIPTSISKITGAYSFENGTIQEWYGGVVVKKNAYNGNYSISNQQRGSNLPENYQHFVSKVVNKLDIGEKYVFSAYVKADGGGNVREEDYVQLSAGYPSNQSDKLYLKDLRDWTRITVPFEARISSVSLQLITNAKDPLSIYWDAIQIERGTEATDFEKEVISTSNSLLAGPDDASVSLVLYVFSNHKQEVPGWKVDYAGRVKSKTIERLAYDDNGDPWIKNSKDMYLTRLSRTMKQSDMTSDVYLRQSENDDTVGAGSSNLLSVTLFTKIILVLVVPIFVEMVVFVYFWFRRSKK